jgi:hypothetical protein
MSWFSRKQGLNDAYNNLDRQRLEMVKLRDEVAALKSLNSELIKSFHQYVELVQDNRTLDASSVIKATLQALLECSEQP